MVGGTAAVLDGDRRGDMRLALALCPTVHAGPCVHWLFATRSFSLADTDTSDGARTVPQISDTGSWTLG
jgi:hypothetical protein